MVLAGISAAALAGWRRRPYLIVGWLWYVGILVPMIGLVQAGGQARADRYTYLPQIGLCIALTWAAADMFHSWPRRRWLCGVASASVLAVLMGLCVASDLVFAQTSETLWTHTLACTSRKTGGPLQYGLCLPRGSGQTGKALQHYQQALEIQPNYVIPHLNLGAALTRLGRLDEAMAHYRQVLELKPGDIQAHWKLGVILTRLGRFDEAMAHYRKALETPPDDAAVYYDYGNLLAGRGRLDEALAQYRQALEIDPSYAMGHNNLGSVLLRLGRFDEAMAHFQQAVKIQPDYVKAHNNLGTVLTRLGRLDEAMTHYRKVLELDPNNASAYYNLGVLLADRGQFEEALGSYEHALKIQPDDAMAHCKLSWLRATCPSASLRNGVKAIEQAEQANRLCEGKQPEVLDALAAAYAEAGWFPEALAAAHKAVDFAQPNNQALLEGLRSRIALYEAGKPYRQPPPARAPAKP